MAIYLVGGVKGGSGKTTLATNLAAGLALAGRDVILVDADAQGSSADWGAVRDEQQESAPRVATVQVSGNAAGRQIRDLAGRYEDVVIDAGGRDSVELRSSMTVCDRLVVPIQASQFDVWAVGPMAELIEQAQALNEFTATAVLWRASTHPKSTEADEAAEIMADYPGLTLAQSRVGDRVAFRRVAVLGLSALEQSADNTAATEIRNLIEEIKHGS